MIQKRFINRLSTTTLFLVLALMVRLMAACASAQDTSESDTDNAATAGVLCDLSNSGYNPDESVSLDYNYTWSCTEDERLLSTNGVPDHEIGTFPNEGNRNNISAQDISASFTLTPLATDTSTEMGGPRGTIAFALNGIKFDPGTGGTCDDSGDNCSLGGNVGQWRIEALGQDNFNFGEDFNNAHVQPGGSYHYHGMPESLLSELGNGEAMTLVGWAADGFPVYARYGYSEAMDASSDIKVITGSYQLKDTPDENRPATDLYEMGSFTQDYTYVEGSGDLDECNGRFGVTPEFPEGIYHYYVTDSYPFMTRCVKGEVTVNQGPGGGQGGQGETSFDVEAAAATLGVPVEALKSALGQQ